MTARPEHLSDLQVEVARVFFGLPAAEGYLVAGGAALVASGLVARPTEDLDLFAAAPTSSVAEAKDALIGQLVRSAYAVAVVHDSATFCRMVVTRAGDQTLVDLAIDAPPIGRATLTVLGPTLAPLELAGRKLLALFGRAEARDFADVYVLAQRFGKDALVAQARLLDRGFEPGVLAQMMRTLSRFDDSEVPLGQQDILAARAYFAEWAHGLGESVR